MREPWRNTLAHLLSTMTWENFLADYGQLELAEYLKKKPIRTYQNMIRLQKNAPLVSSAGRLFDAVAGAIGLCRESVSFEGQAAMQLQVLAEEAVFNSESDGCGFTFKIGIWPSNGLPYLDPLPMWQTLLHDLRMEYLVQ